MFLLVINLFNICRSKKVFILLSFMKDNFARYKFVARLIISVP